MARVWLVDTSAALSLVGRALSPLVFMTVRFTPDQTDFAQTASVDAFAGEAHSSFYALHGKRWFDLTLVLVAMPVVLPLIAVITLVMFSCGGAPLYSQMRVGKDGKLFRIWKFRTMVRNADQHLESYLRQNPAARAEWNATQKLKNDPRITRLGRILRKSSIDELPQLWNVLTGTMSLVGPRPMMPTQQSYYNGASYFQLRPGITGLWQVSARNTCEFANRVHYDEEYGRVISFKTDIQTLTKTVSVVVRATGH